MNEQDRQLLKILVRSREDFQKMRITNDNRLGLKADGDQTKNVIEKHFIQEDAEMLSDVSNEARKQEKEIEKKLKKVLKRFPVWVEFLNNVKGCGEVSAAYIISEFDINKATTVSKMWQYAGLNPGLVRGKKVVTLKSAEKQNLNIIRKFTDKKGIEKAIIITDEMIRGDKMSEGFLSPYNKKLRIALCGVMADCFIKAKNSYRFDFYDTYKTRLENSEYEVAECGKNIKWSDAKKNHRHRAAVRYMVKMFIKDLYNVWRKLEGLPVRPTYQEEKLQHKHCA